MREQVLIGQPVSLGFVPSQDQVDRGSIDPIGLTPRLEHQPACVPTDRIRYEAIEAGGSHPIRSTGSQVDPRPCAVCRQLREDLSATTVVLRLEVDASFTGHVQAAYDPPQPVQPPRWDDGRDEEIRAASAGLVDEEMDAHQCSIGYRTDSLE